MPLEVVARNADHAEGSPARLSGAGALLYSPRMSSTAPGAALSRIGILTGGGDAPGLNAVIRAVVKSAANVNCEVIGLEDSFDGLIEADRWRKLTPRDVTGILRIGGTILGTANRGNPVRRIRSRRPAVRATTPSAASRCSTS